ncbi:GMC oxidoreductase [Aaosphaeria arxii CBS 175.79]|uniref:GMC oxidoreductase n=1 Tax=Aaosphaeria arxii CBS 175.79 TaxID=1450172 RepID=A0A6A5XDY2_9PLEO|nr:GMC oxidoreductase [Aaosphaeria arxii CBS 175.79]KAF2011071.1 GMC oxidoreductase [Aaosphaeria arxii CBS 175.79]
MPDQGSVFDYIVVGGGTAGVAIASRLSKYLPNCKIALFESGPDATHHPKVNDPNLWPSLIQEGLLVDYQTTPQVHLDDRVVPANLAGRLLSGSSGTNVGVWMRASRTDYDVIAKAAGHSRFTFEKLLPYFKRLENHWDVNAGSKYHGFSGPFRTVGGREYPLRQPILQSAERLGIPYNPDSANGDPTGVSDLTQNFRIISPSKSERQQSAKVYDLTRVHVECDSPVARIIVDTTGTAKGLELVSGQKFHSRREVIISCGAHKTPQILLLSGIGPREELEKHRIPQILNSPAVGQNLHDHSQLTLFFKLRDPKKGQALPFNGTMKPEFGHGTPWEFNIFSHIPASELSPILTSDGLPGVADETHSLLGNKRCHTMTMPIYFPIQANPLANPDIGIMAGTHVSFVALHLLPVSRGTIALKSANPKDEPIIDPKFMSTNTDRYIIRRAIRDVLRLVETEPLASELDGEAPPLDHGHPALTSKSTDGEIDARVRRYVSTISHPMGTCALGKVLDTEFRVKGVKGLRVCDASVFPEPLGAMPMQTIYALAELCADLIAGQAET